jgi:hypothetical protein
MILGMIVGGGMLTKTNANFALILLPFLFLLFNFKQKNSKQKLFQWVIFALVATFIANVMYSILRLSPFFHIINDKNYVFIYPLSEWIHHPFTYFLSNFSGLTSWLIGYATIPFLILVLTAFAISYKYTKEKLLLAIWFIIPFIALATFGKTIYPRFILFMTMPLLVLAAYALFTLTHIAKKRWLQTIILIVFIGMFLFNDYYIITDFPKAPIPQADRSQFITSWAGGIGVRETIDFLRQQSQNQKIFVGTEGTFGLMPYALEIYLVDNPNIKIKAYWPVSDLPPKDALEASQKMPTYFVFYEGCVPCQTTGIAPKSWKVTPIMQFQREEKGSYYTLYKLESRIRSTRHCETTEWQRP